MNGFEHLSSILFFEREKMSLKIHKWIKNTLIMLMKRLKIVLEICYYGIILHYINLIEKIFLIKRNLIYFVSFISDFIGIEMYRRNLILCII